MPNINKDTEIMKALAVKLRQLLDREPELIKDITSWYAAAETFRSELTTEDIDLMPHFVFHYLDDADIRIKEKSYKEQQEKEIEGIIKALEKGKTHGKS